MYFVTILTGYSIPTRIEYFCWVMNTLIKINYDIMIMILWSPPESIITQTATALLHILLWTLSPVPLSLTLDRCAAITVHVFLHDSSWLICPSRDYSAPYYIQNYNICIINWHNWLFHCLLFRYSVHASVLVS